jgi:excisionase family DNA binding protein
MSVTPLPNWLTVPELARHAGVSEWTIRSEIDRGNLTARRVGRLVRVLDSEASRWMKGES